MSIWEGLLIDLMQALCLLSVPLFLTGVIRKTKARLQGRRGPRLLQPYYDVFKYLRKEATVSRHASWFTKVTPYTVLTATFVSGLCLPLAGGGSILKGDILLFLYLLAVARFFTALAALDSGSSFGGMGASREMALNTVIEPAFMLAVLTVVLQAGTTSFSGMTQWLIQSNISLFHLPLILAACAMLLVVLAEAGRIPVDNPDTHLELTMIHEGMLLEYSGRHFGLMVLSGAMKEFMMVSLFVVLFLPFGQPEITGLGAALIGLALTVGKVIAVGIVLAIVEMMYAKVRLFQVPKLFATSMTLSLLAIVVHFLF